MTVIEIRPSRLLAMILVALHLAAAFSFLFGFGGGPVSAAAGVGLGVSGWYCWRHCRRVPEPLGLLEDGTLLVASGGAVERKWKPQPATVVTDPAVWLCWQADGGQGAGALLLLRDQLAPYAWTELQVWLRLRARRHIEGPQGLF